MELLDILRNSWFVIIGILFAGYAILDGFDLGTGILMPFIAKNKNDSATLTNSIWPFWDGNEVWLLTAGASMFAAFPDAYATVFSGFYLAIMTVVFCLILRAVSLEFMRYDEARYGLWRRVFIGASMLVSLLLGVALGNVIEGIPLDGNFNYMGDFLHLLRPFPLIIGVLGFCAILMQGASWAVLKSDGELKSRAQSALKKTWAAFFIVFICAFILSLVYIPELTGRPGAVYASVLTVAAWYAVRIFYRKGREGWTFAATSAVFAGLWGISGALLYPALVRDSHYHNSITIFNASSSELTLKIMLIFALIGMPAVVAYTVWVYKIFRGKSDPEGY